MEAKLRLTVRFEGQPPLKFMVTVTGDYAYKAIDQWTQMKKVVRPIVDTIGYLDASRLAVARTIHLLLHSGAIAEKECKHGGTHSTIIGTYATVKVEVEL